MKTYTVFEQLLEKRGAKIADVVRATGISFSTFADWKNGRISQPKYERLRMIAESGNRKRKRVCAPSRLRTK